MDEEQTPITAAAAFSALAILRNTEVQMRWEGAKLGMYFNIPGFIGALSQLALNPSKRISFLIIAGSMLGALANQYLYMSIRRAGKHFQFWCLKTKELEAQCSIEGGVQIFTSTGYTRLQKHKLKTQGLLLGITQTCMFVWVFIGTMALGSLLFGG